MFNFNIDEGTVEYYYCFDLKNKKYLNYISEKLDSNLCNIIKKETKCITLKHEYENYFDQVLNKSKKGLSKSINEEIVKSDFESSIKVLNIEDDLEENDLDEVSLDIDLTGIDLEFTEKGFNINLKNIEEEFIYEELDKFITGCNEDKKYLGSEMIKDVFFFQPISVCIENSKKYIFASGTLHTSGQLIIKYHLKIENIQSKEFYLEKFRQNYKCKIPNYIISNSKKIEYSKAEFTIKEAIEFYNEYIIKITKRNKKSLLKSPIFFENLILEEYEKKPQDFNGVSKDLKESLYFMVNRPYGYVNDRYSDEYDAFIKNRHDMSRYASIFCGTSRRMLVAYNRNFNLVNEEIRNSIGKGYMASIYVSAAIKLLIINRSFYDDVFESSYEDIKNIKNIKKIQRELLFCQDFNFYNLKSSYGSVKKLYNYMENNLTDFFPKDILDNKVEIYNKIIDSNYSIEKEKLNRRISLAAVIATVLFGLSGVEKLILDIKINMGTIIANLFGKESLETLNNCKINIINKFPLLEGVNTYFIIWVFLCVIMIIFFYKERLVEVLKYITKIIKYIYLYIKYAAQNKKS